MWKNVSVKIDWNEYAKACLDVAETATAIKETYSEKIDNVADIADKIADAIDIEKDEHTTTKQINERM